MAKIDIQSRTGRRTRPVFSQNGRKFAERRTAQNGREKGKGAEAINLCWLLVIMKYGLQYYIKHIYHVGFWLCHNMIMKTVYANYEFGKREISQSNHN